MTTKDLIEKLQKMPKDKECLLAINQSAGFPDDHIDVYPIEEVFARYWNEDGLASLSGYCEDEWNDDAYKEEKVLLYVYP
jgi:hypothetical protein